MTCSQHTSHRKDAEGICVAVVATVDVTDGVRVGGLAVGALGGRCIGRARYAVGVGGDGDGVGVESDEMDGERSGVGGVGETEAEVDDEVRSNDDGCDGVCGRGWDGAWIWMWTLGWA